MEEGPNPTHYLKKLNWYYHNIITTNRTQCRERKVTIPDVRIKTTTAAPNQTVLWAVYSTPNQPHFGAEEGDDLQTPRTVVFKKPNVMAGLTKVAHRDFFSPLRKSRIYIKSRFSRVRQWCRPIVIWSLWLNIALLFFCHAVFYGIKFKVSYTLQ